MILIKIINFFQKKKSNPNYSSSFKLKHPSLINDNNELTSDIISIYNDSEDFDIDIDTDSFIINM